MSPRAAWQSALVRLAGAIFIIGLVGFTGAVTIADRQTGTVATLSAINPEVVWHKWDSLWYERIAVHGYGYQLDDRKGQAAAAYFPLYPLIVGTILKAAPAFSFFWTGAILSTLCTLAALALIAGGLSQNETLARRALLVTLASAGAFYLVIPYTEGLFLLLVVATMVLTRKRHYVWAGACCGLAAVTRVHGLALIAVPVISCLLDSSQPIRRRQQHAAIALILFAIPFGIYLAYMSHIQGTAGAFLARQSFWGNATPYPFRAFVGVFEHPTWPEGLLHGAFWLLSVAALWHYRRAMTPGEALFCAGALVISTQQATFQGIYRYVTPLVPLTLAIAADGSPLRRRIVVFSLLFATFMILAFVTRNRLAV